MKSAYKKFIPKPYQEEGIALFLQKSFAGLFWPPGLGKTAVALFAFDILRKKGFVKRMYVFSTKKVVTNTWPREIKKWTPHLSYTVAVGGPKKKIEALAANTDIVLMNNESMAWFVNLVSGTRKKVKRRWQILKPERPDLAPKEAMLIVDESSKWRNSGSKRFEAISRKTFKNKKKVFLNLFKRRYILTGSPAPRSLLNLWSQMFLIDLGESLGEYVTHFRIKYFHPAGFKGYGWELKPKAAKKIYKRLVGRILRVGEGVLKMPKLQFIPRPIYLEEEEREVYNEMEREFIIELSGDTITAANSGVKTAKLRQLANGFIYSSEKDKKQRITHHVHNAKAMEVRDLIEETQGTPALVAYQLNGDLEILEEVLDGMNYEVVSSNTSDKDFDEIERRWNEGEIEILLGQADIIAFGLNLQDTHAIVIYFTIPWDLEVFEQLYRRVWRQGQKYPVIVYLPLVQNSVDDKVVWPSTQKKDKRQRHLLDNLEKFMARRKKFTRPESLTKVGNKEGMEILADFMVTNKQAVPKVDVTKKDPGGVLLSVVIKRVKAWGPETREQFCQAVAGETYDGPTEFGTVKKMVEEIFCADIEKPIKPDTYKMWKGFKPKRKKKMATNKSKFASKKGSKKKTKKTAKKSAKKKTAAKKTAEVKISKKSYVFTEGTPKMEIRAKLCAHIKKAKGRGVTEAKAVEWAVDKLGLTEARAIGHLKGCVSKGFLKTK